MSNVQARYTVFFFAEFIIFAAAAFIESFLNVTYNDRDEKKTTTTLACIIFGFFFSSAGIV
jgi:hypothetical protein